MLCDQFRIELDAMNDEGAYENDTAIIFKRHVFKLASSNRCSNSNSILK